jgi:hypothetical protein
LPRMNIATETKKRSFSRENCVHLAKHKHETAPHEPHSGGIPGRCRRWTLIDLIGCWGWWPPMIRHVVSAATVA